MATDDSLNVSALQNIVQSAIDEVNSGPLVKDLKITARELLESIKTFYSTKSPPEGFGKLKRKVAKELVHLQSVMLIFHSSFLENNLSI